MDLVSPGWLDRWSILQREARLRLLRMHYESGVGHIGGNLSCLDLLLLLHHAVLKPGDQFVLSKGHSAGAYYVTLWTLGQIDDDELCEFHQDNTRLSGHPPTSGIPEILFATGSLGHGFSLAAGLALGKKLRGDPGTVYCLTSDGEWNEGSCWEALIFARQQKLSNLVLMIDVNGFQGFGSTRDVANLEPLVDKFLAFGVPTSVVDGHAAAAVLTALAKRQPRSGPRVVIAKTHKGHGVSFMEDRMEWHYLPMTHIQYQHAMVEVENLCEMSSASL